MDVIQDWSNYILSQATPSRLSQLYSLTNTPRTYALILIDSITHTSPSLATVALLLIIFLISLKILDMLWRAVVFWVKLATRIVFWGGIAVLGCWVYVRGVEGVVEDVGSAVGKWRGEYDRYSRLAGDAKVLHQRGGGGARGRREGAWGGGRRW
ncbi:hypothetical protein EJ08DRAFT_239079 [Tothia fuscella]|uniref:Nuclear pore assembly and biogenesis-domain-containing protein n=1 Tax=Tothia fuscella TaxID=1048955 RepID=A0A9P4NR73_9PEZI|nr:hypothetical protein EJ08DRAFT_239079 [Tothia fuscella]